MYIILCVHQFAFKWACLYKHEVLCTFESGYLQQSAVIGIGQRLESLGLCECFPMIRLLSYFSKTCIFFGELKCVNLNLPNFTLVEVQLNCFEFVSS